MNYKAYTIYTNACFILPWCAVAEDLIECLLLIIHQRVNLSVLDEYNKYYFNTSSFTRNSVMWLHSTWVQIFSTIRNWQNWNLNFHYSCWRSNLLWFNCGGHVINTVWVKHEIKMHMWTSHIPLNLPICDKSWVLHKLLILSSTRSPLWSSACLFSGCDWLSRLSPGPTAASLSHRSCCAHRRACRRRGRRWGGGWLRPRTGSASWRRTCWESPREACRRRRSSIGEWCMWTRWHQSSRVVTVKMTAFAVELSAFWFLNIFIIPPVCNGWTKWCKAHTMDSKRKIKLSLPSPWRCANSITLTLNKGDIYLADIIVRWFIGLSLPHFLYN